MSYGPFYAARNTKTGELFTSLRGRQVFNSKGALSNALGQHERRVRVSNRADYEVFEISMIDTDRLNGLLETERYCTRLMDVLDTFPVDIDELMGEDE